MQLIQDREHQPDDVSGRAMHLAQVLEALRSEIENGRLAIGYIHERYNQAVAEEMSSKNENSTGAFLRRLALTITTGKYNANGKRATHCLVWDKRTQSFLEKYLQRQQVTTGQQNPPR